MPQPEYFDNGCVVDTRRRPRVLVARIAYADPDMKAALVAEARRVYWVRRLTEALTVLLPPE
jgi:hypothetical protein